MVKAMHTMLVDTGVDDDAKLKPPYWSGSTLQFGHGRAKAIQSSASRTSSFSPPENIPVESLDVRVGVGRVDRSPEPTRMRSLR